MFLALAALCSWAKRRRRVSQKVRRAIEELSKNG
jgi:hypothetical protein